MVVPGLIFISVEQHDGYFRAGHQKSKAEEKQQVQYDPRQAEKRCIQKGARFKVTVIETALFKAVPEFQHEKFHSGQKRKNDPRGHPAIGL